MSRFDIQISAPFLGGLVAGQNAGLRRRALDQEDDRIEAERQYRDSILAREEYENRTRRAEMIATQANRFVEQMRLAAQFRHKQEQEAARNAAMGTGAAAVAAGGAVADLSPDLLGSLDPSGINSLVNMRGAVLANRREAAKAAARDMDQRRQRDRNLMGMASLWASGTIPLKALLPTLQMYGADEADLMEKANAVMKMQYFHGGNAARDLAALHPQADPARAEAAARLRLYDMPIGLGEANLSGETPDRPVRFDDVQKQRIGDAQRAVDDALANFKDAHDLYAKSDNKTNKAVRDKAEEEYRRAKRDYDSVVESVISGTGAAKAAQSSQRPPNWRSLQRAGREDAIAVQVIRELGPEATQAQKVARAEELARSWGLDTD